MSSPVLDVKGLTVHYVHRGKTIRAVDGVSLRLPRGEVLALVGESGCGKSTFALAVLGLVPSPGKLIGGSVLLDGADLLRMNADDVRRVRGRDISIIFQDPQSGLNPVLPVGVQVMEIITTHLRVPKREAKRMMLEALARTGLGDPERVAEEYPFQLSGGMCQRVMIAIATVLRPRVIIADEPTSSLDVTVQAAILRELEALRRELGISILLITHDFGVVAQMADEVAIMYAGRVVEEAPVREIFARPLHPYTWSLLATRPRVDGSSRPLPSIRGLPPDLADLSGDCAFLPRCPKATSACRREPWPALEEASPGHKVACFNPVYHAPAEKD